MLCLIPKVILEQMLTCARRVFPSVIKYRDLRQAELYIFEAYFGDEELVTVFTTKSKSVT